MNFVCVCEPYYIYVCIILNKVQRLWWGERGVGKVSRVREGGGGGGGGGGGWDGGGGGGGNEKGVNCVIN